MSPRNQAPGPLEPLFEVLDLVSWGVILLVVSFLLFG